MKKNIKTIYKEYTQPPVFRRFWRKDKSGEVMGVYADFTHKTSHVPVATSKDCFVFSWCISEFIMIPLKNMLNNAIATGNNRQTQQIMRTINWLRKKAFKHSAEVRNEMKAMSEHPEFLNMAGYTQVSQIIDETSSVTEKMVQHPTVLSTGQKLGLNPADIKEIMLKIAGLHDIGRLAEIDLNSGTKFNGTDMIAHEVNGQRVPVKGVDHAITSYEVAKNNGITNPLILLPIKYHSLKDLEPEITTDSEYQTLDDTTKKQVLFFTHCIRDADKIANLISYTKTGIKLCGEMNDPDFHGNNDITQRVVNQFMSGKIIDKNEAKTYLDAMLKFVAWTYDLHFDFNKERATQTIIDPLFERMREQNRDELADTIKQVRHGWFTYEKLLYQQQKGELPPHLKEQLTTLKESYIPKEDRPEYIHKLGLKAQKTLSILNEAHTYITNYMANSTNTRQENNAAASQSVPTGKSSLPRTKNTSALFQIKRRANQSK